MVTDLVTNSGPQAHTGGQGLDSPVDLTSGNHVGPYAMDGSGRALKVAARVQIPLGVLVRAVPRRSWVSNRPWIGAAPPPFRWSVRSP